MLEPPLSHEQLLEEIETLESQFDEIEESEWLAKAIPLYRELVRVAPQEKTYQKLLMNHLLAYGGDLKMRLHHYERAEKVFQELVKIDRNHTMAYYRLGFLAFYQEKWELATERFRKALNRRPSGTPPLSEEQRVNALLYMSKSYKSLLQRSMSRLTEEFESLENLAVIQKLEPAIDQFRDEVRLEEEDKYYILIDSKGRHYLNRVELEESQEQMRQLPPDVLYLDFTENEVQCVCKTSIDRIQLSRQRAKILHYLVENRNRSVPYQELFHLCGLRPSNSNVRAYVTRTWESIEACFLEDKDRCIVNRNGGYQWIWDGDYYIFYRRDELEYAELEVE